MARAWARVKIPYEAFVMCTPSGKAMVFEILDGEPNQNEPSKGWSFVYPASLVRNTKDKTGFEISYSIDQTKDTNGDVVAENPMSLTMRYSEKDGEKWVVRNELEIGVDELEAYYIMS